MKLRSIPAAAAAFAVLAVSAPVWAEPLEDAVKARQGYFQMLKFNLGGLAAMAKGEAEYDPVISKIYADNIESLSKLNTGPMWAKGTDNEAMAGKTRALPAIWSDGGIGAKSKAFSDAAAELAGAAGTGLDALRPAVGKVGGTCKGCHDDYRAKTF